MSLLNSQNNLIINADSHSIADSGESMIDSLGTTLSNAGKFLEASAISGGAGIYNTAVAVGNLFGADAKELNIYETIGNMDSDLAAYYRKNQQSVDAFGFVATSFIPGIMGIKGMQAGSRALLAAKAGKWGLGTEVAGGLLPAFQKKFAAQAAEELVSNREVFKLANANFWKAWGMGAADQVVQAAAFELAVGATMFNSPVYKDNKASDIFWHMGEGVLFGGTIGTVIEGATTWTRLTKAVRGAATKDAAFGNISELTAGAPADARLYAYMEQKLTTPSPIRLNTGNEVADTKQFNYLTHLTNMKHSELENRIIGVMTEVASGDTLLARRLSADLMKQTDLGAVQATLMGLKSVTRVADDIVSGERLVTKAKVSKNGEAVSWVSAVDGNVESAILPRLADTLKKDETIKFTEDAVIVAGVKKPMYQYPIPGTPTINKVPIFSSVADATIDRMDVEARFMWALNKKVTPSELTRLDEGTKRTMLIDGNDLPMLERMEKHWETMLHDSAGIKVFVQDTSNATKEFRSKDELTSFINFRKVEMVQELAPIMDASEIAQRLNVSKAFAVDPYSLLSVMPEDGIMSATEQLAHTRTMQSMMYQGDNGLVLHEWAAPMHYKVTYDTGAVSNIATGISGEAYFKQITDNLKMEAEQVLNLVDPDLVKLLPEIDPKLMATASRANGAAPSTFFSANGEYGSLASYTQRIGAIVAEKGIKARNDVTQKLMPSNLSLRQDPAALREYNFLDNIARRFTDKYVSYALPVTQLGEEVKHLLIPKELKGAIDKLADKESLHTFLGQQWELNARHGNKGVYAPLTTKTAGLEQFGLKAITDSPDTPLFLPMSPKVASFVNEHIASNSERLRKVEAIMAAKGIPIADHIGTYYPAPLDLNATPHYAFVRSNAYGTTSHQGVIFGRNAEDLATQIGKIDPKEFTVIRKKEQEDLHKLALNDYNWEMGITERNVDSAMKRKGILHYFTPPVDSTRILDDTLAWHGNKAEQTVREGVAHYYSSEIGYLTNLARSAGAAETSVFSGITSRLLSQSKVNPFQDYVNTMLNISRRSDFPLQTASTWIEQHVDGMWNGIKTKWNQIRSPYDDKAIAELNQYAAQKGLKEVYTDAAMIALNDTTLDKNLLSKVVGRTNSAIAGTMLGMDFFNGLNNVIGSMVLTSSEIKYFQNLAKQHPDPEVAKLFSAMLGSKAPGTEIYTMTPAKLIAQAHANLIRGGTVNIKGGGIDSPLLARYKEKGFIGDELQRQRQMMHDASIAGSEDWGAIKGMPEKVFDVARKITGNKLAEDTTRGVAANIGDMFTTPLVQAGLMTQKQADVMIHSMVNKVNGNYLASQRARITQGALGQAATLFLTYQMNMIQQMFKYVGNGDKRAAITAMLAQGSMYGMQGLPGFNYINAKVANLTGNTENTDMYDLIKGGTSDGAFELMMYGLGSNALGVINPGLKSNMYNRGDLNPRNPFLIPESIDKIPAVSITTNFLSNIWNTGERLAKGGDVGNALLMGLEHNSINRPLAGLAQAINGRVTTNSGTLLFDTGDKVSVANFTRIAGGQPLAEAMAKDWLYRQQAYQATDRQKLKELGTVFKTVVQDGYSPTSEELEDFMGSYVNAGGNQENFGAWVNQQTMGATQSVFADIKEKLRSPFATYLQKELGGASLYSEPDTTEEEEEVNLPEMGGEVAN